MSDLRKEIERQFKLLGLFEPDKKTTEKIHKENPVQGALYHPI